MNNAFEDAFQRVFSAPTEKVQNKRLKASRLKSKHRSSATTPLLPAEANERPSTTYSEQPQGERHE